MKIISWNARGLNNQAKHGILKRKFQKEKPDIIFIQETKCDNTSMANFSKRLGKYIDYMEVESPGWEGGLVTI